MLLGPAISALVRLLALLSLLACAGIGSAVETTPTPMSTFTRITPAKEAIEIDIASSGIDELDRLICVALGTSPEGGHAQVPFGQHSEGSSVFLPFRANRIYYAHLGPNGLGLSWRKWAGWQWSTHLDVKPEFTLTSEPGRIHISVRLSALDAPLPPNLKLAVWVKDIAANNGWGNLLANGELGFRGGFNDQYIDRYFEVNLQDRTATIETRRGAASERVRIYQLLPRLFSNTNTTRKSNGTMAENGVGKFRDINEAALRAIREMNCTHVWYTGVLAQATSTDYSEIGLPADDADLLKGLAGSPYAIRDYFDVCPDYATNPANRLEEFKALLERTHAAGLKAIIDLVPNHVARSYHSTIRPELSFGRDDDRKAFFSGKNNFFWLQASTPGGGPPLRLPTVAPNGDRISPTCKVLRQGDGIYDGEREHGRVTGNNSVTWRPGMNDWYETVKLNYGYNFITRERAYPHSLKPDAPVPDTWLKVDEVIAYWQSMGVDGFRCDMAHMVPPEFWAWALDRARKRKPDTFFAAEAYDNDPMKVGLANVMIDLLAAGFDAVYDDPGYKTLKNMYDGQNWANDLDGALSATERELIFQNSLRYTENHDEVRIAGQGQWGDHGPTAGKAASAILYGLARGPILLYSGQEVGEPAAGAEGFGGDDARTTIFDYWSMPEVVKWVNFHRYDGGQLSPEQKALRAYYSRLLGLVGQPAFQHGEFFALNYANRENSKYGRLPGETVSGHWMYSFLRCDLAIGQRYLIVANLHPKETLRNVEVTVPVAALNFIDLPPGQPVRLTERLGPNALPVMEGIRLGDGLKLKEIPPLTTLYFEVATTKP